MTRTQVQLTDCASQKAKVVVTPDSDCGFEFVEALCQAIEDFTSKAEAANQDAFKYRGANLKHAVERHLYFTYLNNQRLFQCFVEWRRDCLPETIKCASKTERSLAICLLDSGFDESRFRVTTWNFRKIFRPIRLWTNRVRSLLGPPQSTETTGQSNRGRRLYSHEHSTSENSREQSPAILIQVVHGKFLQYLHGITDGLPVSYAYLLDSDQELTAQCTNASLPFVNIKNICFTKDSEEVSDALKPFVDLARSFDRWHFCLEQLKPHCVVIVEGNAAANELMNQVCQQLNIPTVCLQHGWSPIVHNGFRNMSYSKFLTWGKGFAELLEPYNLRQLFIPVGSHMIDAPRNGGQDTNYEATGQAGIGFMLQRPTRLITEECWDAVWDLVLWTARQFPQVPVMVREHPGYPLSERKHSDLQGLSNVRMRPADRYPLAPVLSQCRLTVSVYSSTILESVAAASVPMILNLTSMPHYTPDVDVWGAGVEVKNFDDAKTVIRSALSDDEYLSRFRVRMQQFREHFFHSDQSSTLDRIVQQIMAACQASTTTMTNGPAGK